MAEIAPDTQATGQPRRKWRSYSRVVLGIVLAAGVGIALLLFLGGPGRLPPPVGEAEVIPLPPAETLGGMALTETLARRRSQREFGARRPSPAQLGQLCWAAQGITDEGGQRRTAPSAGALYPITVYVVDPDGVSAYIPQRHALRPALSGDRRPELRDAAGGQPWVGTAPVCVVLTADVGHTAGRYGARAERYCLLEAGHVAQNVLLQATALGLVGVPVGAFDEGRVSAALRLPSNLRPLYLIPLGYPSRS